MPTKFPPNSVSTSVRKVQGRSGQSASRWTWTCNRQQVHHRVTQYRGSNGLGRWCCCTRKRKSRETPTFDELLPSHYLSKTTLHWVCWVWLSNANDFFDREFSRWLVVLPRVVVVVSVVVAFWEGGSRVMFSLITDCKVVTSSCCSYQDRTGLDRLSRDGNLLSWMV